jgi:hypothetical protein
MVQIIGRGPRDPSFGQKFSGAVGAGLQQMQQSRQVEQQAQALEGMGLDPRISQLPPEAQAAYFKQQFSQPKISPEEQQLQNISTETVTNAFGQKFGDLWNAATVQGKSELLKFGLDAVQRNQNVDDLLKGINPPNARKDSNTPEAIEEMPQMNGDELPKGFDWPDFSKPPSGYTIKDWNAEKSGWRKENSPIFLENKTKLNNTKKDLLATKKLTSINEKKILPEGFDRILIDPETGDFRPLAKVAGFQSPEAEEWSKEIARFQNRAKDAFGSRVTNFDLQSYMKQFPNLLNSPEGRRRILEMMQTNYRLDQIYHNALDKVYKKYKLNGISQEDADELAQRLIENEADDLRQKYLNLDEENQFESSNETPELSGKMIEVIGPDGQTYEIDENEMDLLPEGFRIQ